MKGIYLAAFKAKHDVKNLVYQDINGKRDIGGDMLEVDLSTYDYVIATPPCNYYSRMNFRRDSSTYALMTKHLLPSIVKKLSRSGIKYWIVENVRNYHRFDEIGLFDFPCFVYFIGRHTYWTNVMLCTDVPQKFDFKKGVMYVGSNENDESQQGGYNVHQVIQLFLETIGAD